jgi:TPR repeat protein
MKKREIVTVIIFFLVAGSLVYAMTDQQAMTNQQARLLSKGSASDLGKLSAAAKNGNAYAELNLGVAYSKGQGVPQNTMTAIHWWKKAAAQGGGIGKTATYLINMAEHGQGE